MNFYALREMFNVTHIILRFIVVFRMLASPAEPLKIDWASYKKTVAVPGLVDTFEKAYAAVKIPYPEDKYTTLIDKNEKAIVIISVTRLSMTLVTFVICLFLFPFFFS